MFQILRLHVQAVRVFGHTECKFRELENDFRHMVGGQNTFKATGIDKDPGTDAPVLEDEDGGVVLYHLGRVRNMRGYVFTARVDGGEFRHILLEAFT